MDGSLGERALGIEQRGEKAEGKQRLRIEQRGKRAGVPGAAESAVWRALCGEHCVESIV